MNDPAPHPRPDLSPEQARAFWYGLINFEQRTPTPDDLKLDRMRALLARLGNPQNRLRILHVAGTKGKGSTAAMLGVGPTPGRLSHRPVHVAAPEPRRGAFSGGRSARSRRAS